MIQKPTDIHIFIRYIMIHFFLEKFTCVELFRVSAWCSYSNIVTKLSLHIWPDSNRANNTLEGNIQSNKLIFLVIMSFNTCDQVTSNSHESDTNGYIAQKSSSPSSSSSTSKSILHNIFHSNIFPSHSFHYLPRYHLSILQHPKSSCKLKRLLFMSLKKQSILTVFFRYFFLNLHGLGPNKLHHKAQRSEKTCHCQPPTRPLKFCIIQTIILTTYPPSY